MARIGFAAAAGIVALAIFVVTIWFLGEALMLWIEYKGLPRDGAAGLTGLAGLVLVALLGLAVRLALRPRRRAAVPVTTAPGVNGMTNGIAADLGALAAQQIVGASRAHPYSTMGAALAAGVAMGAVPELRKSVMGLFKH